MGFILFLAMWTNVNAGEKYKISVKNVSLKKGERIEWFTLRYKGSHVISFPNVPEDWTIKINDWAVLEQSNWRGRVDGSIHVGADAVNIHFFEDFIFLETAPEDFDLELITGVSDGDNERKLKLLKNELLLTPLTEKENKSLNHPDWSWGS
jgi:hypothetical protein